jgi:hypothetical protein
MAGQPRKIQPQRPPEPEVEPEEVENEEDFLDDDSEEASPKQTAKASSAYAKSGQVRKAEGSTTKSLAARFDAIASGDSETEKLTPGKYEAIISEAVLQPADAKGQSVRLAFSLCNPEYSDQKSIPQWFKIYDAEGQLFEVGIRMLAQGLARIGRKLTFDDLEEILAELNESKPGVIIKVSYTQGIGRVFTNAPIDGPCDNDMVQAYKDDVAY